MNTPLVDWRAMRRDVSNWLDDHPVTMFLSACALVLGFIFWVGYRCFQTQPHIELRVAVEESRVLQYPPGYVPCIRFEASFYECRPRHGIICYSSSHAMSCLKTNGEAYESD